MSWPAYRRYLQASNSPILAGPFIGEMGLEALYWQPFLRQFLHATGIDPALVIPVTRSGTHVWYGCPKAIEIYGMRTVQDVRIQNRLRNARTGMLKQMTVSSFDRQVLADAAQTLELQSYHVLHPAWMYQTLQPWWQTARGLAWLEPRLRFESLPIPEVPPVLPPKFVAVAFYARATWPATSLTAGIARACIEQIARQAPVILLTSGFHMDDHVDYIPRPLPENVQLLSDLIPMTPETSLTVLSGVLAKAIGFVGTYGGLSHLALRYRIPSVNLYADWGGVLIAHRQLTEALALETKVPYHVLQLNQIPILQDVLPRITLPVTGSSGAREKAVAPEAEMV